MQTGVLTAEDEGAYGLTVISYPGHTAIDAADALKQKTTDIISPAVTKGLTTAPIVTSGPAVAPKREDIVFTGSYDDVNKYYLRKGWSDGLPIVPPTVERVQEFMKYTDLAPDTVLGSLDPAKLEATVWNVGVNGVMAGCRPQYMPVLVAIAEALADPKFSIKDAGSTGGWEMCVYLDGPLMRQLNFNFGVAQLRSGNQANISVSRFARLYCRNIAGLRGGLSDKASFGREYFVQVYVEDEIHSPWPPMSVDLGFKAGTNLVTAQGLSVMTKHDQPGAGTAKALADLLVRKMLIDCQAGNYYVISKGWGPDSHDVFCMTPLIANKLAEGFTKQQFQQYLFDKARLPVSVIEYRMGNEGGRGWKIADQALPAVFYESDDPNRLVPLWRDPKDILIFVAGDYTRNRCFLNRGCGRMGFASPKEVKLPQNWSTLVPEAVLT